jgi:hypothetical protein
MKRYASLEEVGAAGFKRVAAGMYRHGHGIWELRKDDGGYALVRKREERLVDLRHAGGVGTQAAVDSGVIRTASRNPSGFRRVASTLGCPICGSEVHWSCTGQRGAAHCSRSRVATTVPHGPPRIPGPPCPFDTGLTVLRKDGHVDLYAYGKRVGQLTEDEPMDEGTGAESLEFPEGGESAVAGGELADQADALYDAHEVMHGREPELTPDAPLVSAVEEITDEMEGGYEEPLEAEPMDYDEGMDEEYDLDMEGGSGVPGAPAMATGVPGAPMAGGVPGMQANRQAVAPPGREEQVRSLKQEPGVDNPWAVAWSSYNKSKEGAEKCAKCGEAKCACPAKLAKRVAFLMRRAQLSPEMVQQYEQEWQGGRGLQAVLDEVNFLLETRGRVPELERIKQALEQQMAAQPKAGNRTASQRRRGALLEGTKILAIHKGGVAEGVVLEMVPLGDLLADFGHGPEEVALDNVIEPELDLEELEIEDLEEAEENAEDAVGCPDCEHEDCPEGCPEDCPCAAMDDEGDANGDDAGEGGSEPQVLVITVEDVLGM